MITYQKPPRIPPISFFEPISVDPNDMMTDVEFLLGMLKKLNETIKQVNDNTKFIDEYSGKIEQIEAEIADLRREMEDFESAITDEIDQRFAQIKSELQGMISVVVGQCNAYTDAKIAQVEQEIQDIAVGDITVYDPTTGILSPLQTVLDNLYGSTREDALTATEYDALDLTATAYDGYDLTAFNYDKYGKTLLV